MATSLAEEYRPATLADYAGHDKALKRLDAIRARGLTGRAYWIAGPTGTGKTTLARLIAAEMADPFNVEELDATTLSLDDVKRLDRMAHLYPMGAKPGRAYIINEAHGLRAPVIRFLLTALEPIPDRVAWLFTTTSDGQTSLFESKIDASPLVGRCSCQLALSTYGFARPAALRAQAVARAAGLDSRPLADYVKLINTCHGNMRQVLDEIEQGAMKA